MFSSLSVSGLTGPHLQFLIILWRHGGDFHGTFLSSWELSLCLYLPCLSRQELLGKALITTFHLPKLKNPEFKPCVASMALLITLITVMTGEPWNNTFLSCELKITMYWLWCCQNEIHITKISWAGRLIIFVQPFFLNQPLTNCKCTCSLIWEII